jgi:hypothetical protein
MSRTMVMVSGFLSIQMDFFKIHGTNDDEVSPELVQLLHYFEHTNDADGSVQDERIGFWNCKGM